MDVLVLEGQKVDLTRRIREVLFNYPDGTTVPEELTLTRVRLCLDRRVHRYRIPWSGGRFLLSWPTMVLFSQGGFAYEDDNLTCFKWVGFNSVTDTPSLRMEICANPGKRIDYVGSSSALSQYKDQFRSYWHQGLAEMVLFAATASKEYDIHLLPWAFSISDENNILKLGHAFPVRTGLTVQVNGYFEVSSQNLVWGRRGQEWQSLFSLE